jgi:hypothetical protein
MPVIKPFHAAICNGWQLDWFDLTAIHYFPLVVSEYLNGSEVSESIYIFVTVFFSFMADA